MAARPRSMAVVGTAVALLGACGGGSPVEKTSTPGSIDVRVSAGSPMVGANVTVYAISDATGSVDTTAGAGGVLGSAGPTDAAGRAAVTLRSYSGPIQVVASGPAVTYGDPTAEADELGAGPLVQVPSSFVLSSYVARFKPADTIVPVTLLTTLADHAALAYARGLHSSRRSRTTITDALAARDPLLVTHVTKSAAAWDPGALRTTAPASLTTGPQSLVDVAFAAIFDVALNQLARDTGVRAGYSGDSGGFTAPILIQLLEQDLDADGRLDGAGHGGAIIQTAGSTPVVIDARFLRKPLAVSLAAWARNTAVNRSGISDADLVGAQVFRTITEDGSDLFGPAPTEPFDPLDRTPPELSFAQAAPAYSKAGVLNVLIAASDASGTGAVYAQSGATRHTAARRDALWEVAVPLSAVGHNTISIWAEDAAEPAPNSGFGRESPYQLMLDVVYDPEAPSATYDGGFASYSDERGLSVVTGADGLALVPAAYAAGTKVAVQNGGEIFKAATRLAASGAVDAGEIETTNEANIPTLRFSVPYNPSTDSPITKVDYTVNVSCPGCGPFPSAVGSLLASPTASAQALLYELPLSTEFVPTLSSIIGPATIDVSVHLGDAAGNESTLDGFAFTFHVIGPPLAIVEDLEYATYGDLRGTYPYTIAGTSPGINTYATLWDASSPAFFDGAVRLVRYIVSNPSPEPLGLAVSFDQTPGGSWQVTETWSRFNVGEPGSHTLTDPNTAVPFSRDGFTFYQMLYWPLPYGSRGYPGYNKVETSPYPCPGGYAGGLAAHRMGDRTNKYICSPVGLSGTETAVFSVADVMPRIYGGLQQGGGEVLTPERDATGTLFVVPGAAGTVPGTLVLYLTRPVATPRARTLQMNTLLAENRYETWEYDLFLRYHTWSFGAGGGDYTYEVFLVLRSGQYLQSSTEALRGTISATTRGLVANAPFGEPSPVFSSAIDRPSLVTH